MSSSGPPMLLGMFLVLPMAEGGAQAFLVLAAFAGAAAASGPALSFLYGRRVTMTHVVQECAVSFLVLAPAYLVLLAMLLLLVKEPGFTPFTVTAMGIGFLLSILLTVGLGIPIARAVRLLTPPSDRLQSLVQHAAESTGQPVPKVRSLQWHQANAFAFPFAQMIAFTRAAEDRLSDSEINAVAAHELAHLSEPFSARLIRLSGVLVIFPVFTIPVLIREYGMAGILIPLGWMLIGTRLLQAFARRMETRADEIAQQHGKDERELARALEKIYRYNMVPAVTRSKGHTHPHLYDRMVTAGLEPDFPRPKPPGMLLTVICLMILFASALALSLFANGEKLPLPLRFLKTDDRA